MKIRAAVLETTGALRPYRESQPLKIVELELDGPGPTELLVKIDAAGVCHSDLSVVNGSRSWNLPMVLGHEAAGTVLEIGKEVSRVQVGDRVVLSFLPRCGECRECRTNGRLACSVGTMANGAGELMAGGTRLTREGERVYHHVGVSGFASHAVVDERSVAVVPREVPPEIAAVLGCAVLTGGGAVNNAVSLEPGDSLIIVGLGGVGMAALLTALADKKGEIIAVDQNRDKLEHARRLGADTALTPAELDEAGITADWVIEAVGNAEAFETAYGAIGFGGTMVTVGLPAPGEVAHIAPLQLTAGARSVIGSYLGSAIPARDVPAFAQQYLEGQLNAEELISTRIRLEDVNEAMDRLADGEVVRQVMTFD